MITSVGSLRRLPPVVVHTLTSLGGIEEFTDSESAIWASSFDKDFIQGPDRLPESSLCRFVGMETPNYQVTGWANDGQRLLNNRGEDLGLTFYLTPGHTPDQLAIWDHKERFLFVGDSIYEWAAILFPREGNVTTYSKTIGKMKKLVHGWNQEAGKESCSFEDFQADRSYRDQR